MSNGQPQRRDPMDDDDPPNDAGAGGETSNGRSPNENPEPSGNNVMASLDQSPQDIPFLVTHYLANFAAKHQGGSTTDPNNEHNADEALETIRRATNDIASAFASLGAFGATTKPSFSKSFGLPNPSEKKNCSFSDKARQWSSLSPSHLEHLVGSAVSASAVVATSAQASEPANLMLAASEALEHKKPPTGRTLQEAIDLENDAPSLTDNNNSTSAGGNGTARSGNQTVETATSILQAPVLMACEASPSTRNESSSSSSNDKSQVDVSYAEKLTGAESNAPKIPLRSGYVEIATQMAQCMRSLLELRQTVQKEASELKGLTASLKLQEDTKESLVTQRVEAASISEVDVRLQKLDEINGGIANCDRVISQLQRKISDVAQTHSGHRQQLKSMESKAQLWYKKARMVQSGFSDPLRSRSKKVLAKGSRTGGNLLMRDLMSRQMGLSSRHSRQVPNRAILGGPPNLSAIAATNRIVFTNRLSHAVTINTHLTFPVYCFRFDRTGRYFITGSDDYLMKVFYMGAAQSCKTKNLQDGSRDLKCNFGANARGAVLVCSLRGHAGVINDIDVSSDNAFLATASSDGDVRVWGLKDGCPIAILRGHKEGANMVSWSTLTPYRLVTTGSDGFARTWDIRKAALKRYGAYVGKRPEYNLSLLKSSVAESTETIEEPLAVPPLPPIPNVEADREVVGQASGQRNDIVEGQGEAESAIIVPPLPDAVPPLEGALPNAAQNNVENDENAAPGQFVANDILDEGVELLKKFQHGINGPAAGVGTRARRASVNVICVSRCPFGGHFATGSDDGICRVWPDPEDDRVINTDERFLGDSSGPSSRNRERRSTRAQGITDQPLLKLMGHTNAITDLSYSNAGDRILSASQKDGTVRIWTLPNVSQDVSSPDNNAVTQLVIKLTNPGSSSTPQNVRRRAPGSSSGRDDAGKISCDVAVWIHDDSRIATSQCILVKQNGTEIKPGSQYILLWDSYSGHCLLGISGAHTMQCPVLIPHPTQKSLICSGSADGTARIWDWESGCCVFAHENKIEYGPVPESDKKIAGYLDGAFDSNGTTLVLTDECGRVSIFDSLVQSGESGERTVPSWMKEQYFGNDYYDLFYDTNGYCIERGSEQPPHMAPKGARANHSGTAWPDEISEAFGKMPGPVPLPHNVCLWKRQEIRVHASNLAQKQRLVAESNGSVVRRGVREFDPLTTILIKGPGHASETGAQLTSNAQSQAQQPGSSSPQRRSGGTRQLSSNYRWRDFEDPEGEADDDDSEDEEYEQAASSGRRNVLEDTEDEDDDSLGGSPYRQYGRSSQRHRGDVESRRERRTQRQAAPREDNMYVEVGSEDEQDLVEYVSTNTEPSGEFLGDFLVADHFWKLGRAGRVRRKWLQRHEADSSYSGKKIYCPQLGDSVIYVPSSHLQTLEGMPDMPLPWDKWPTGSAWPVTRCSIRGIRYRFPYDSYFKNRGYPGICNSIVAILTLEITGIPEMSEDRDLPWPKPSFVAPTKAHVFEVSIFDNDQCEFVIPECLYVHRLQKLEAALGATRRTRRVPELAVKLFYGKDNASEDDDMVLYDATITGFRGEQSQSNLHLRGSGFGLVKTTSQGTEDFNSPWEIIIEDDESPRPELDAEEKKQMMDLINAQLRNDVVMEHLAQQVNRSQYSDYDKMVEVEMYFMKIKRRIQENFYATKLSVINDIKLIKENCLKYNGVENELTQISMQMYEEVLEQALSDEERSFMISTEAELKAASRTSAGRSSASRPSLRLRIRNSGTMTSDEPAGAGDEVAAEPEVSSQPGRRSLRSDLDTADNQTDGSEDDEEPQQPSASRSSRASRRGRRQAIQESDDSDENEDEAEHEGVHESDDEDSDGEVALSSRSSRRRRRSSTEDDEDQLESSIDRPRRARRRASTREEAGSRRSRRNNPISTYEDPDSDEFDPEDEESEPESESEAESPSRRTRNSRTNYAELPSDYDEDELEEEKPPQKRKRTSSASPRAKKKRGRGDTPSQSAIKRERAEMDRLPDLKDWPEIALKDITAVVNSVLQKVKSLDTLEAFAVPVIENYPDIAEHYLSIVQSPMDLRTIEEERVQSYRSIVEFQEDLIYIFRNCCLYNDIGTELFLYAKSIWEQLNRVFAEACSENGVPLPRRFERSSLEYA